jgi:hypothetical protein
MPADTTAWTTNYRSLRIVLRRRDSGCFEIQVGDGALTHIHPVKGCDFDQARRRAFDLAVQFQRFNRRPAQEVGGPVVLEWEPVAEDARTSGPRLSSASGTI